MSIVKNGWVKIEDMMDHPLNEKIYPRADHQEDIDILTEKMQEWYLDHNEPNHTAVSVCPKTGVVWSGHFRKLCAIILGFKYLKAVEDKRIYDPNADEYDEIQYLKSFNQDGKRNESNPRTALRLWNAQNDAWFNRTGKNLSNRDRNKFAREVRIDNKVFLKIVKIGAERLDLIDQIVSGEMSIKKAYEIVSIPKPKEIIDPNRHIFYGDLIKYPSIKDYIIKRSISISSNMIDVGDNVMDNPVSGWEPQFKTGIFSNALMSAVTEAFNNTGVKKLQCASAGAVSNKTYADVLFQYLTDLANKKAPTNEKYFDTQIEIKAAEWNKTAGETRIYSNTGSANMPEQEFIIGSHCDNFSKFLIMMVTIDGKHWSIGNNKAVISLSKIYQLKPTYLLGKMFDHKNKIEIDWGKFK